MPIHLGRKVYGQPWSKMAGEIVLTPQLLHRLGRSLVKHVVAEAKKDFAKQGRHVPGKPEGLPDSDNFFRSFHHRLVGNRTIEVYSTWPWINQLVEGRDPFPMDWLTRDQGVYRVPIVQDNGTVLIRMAPLHTKDAWIHPGYARHTFLERGIRKGREEFAKLVMDETMAAIARGSPTK